MSYVINNSRGEIVAIIPIGTVNTTATSLSLVGQGVTNYGTAENENYVYLLENFANSTAPNRPIAGQLWYNTATDTMSSWGTDNTWTALATKNYVDDQKISPAFTGTPTAPTPIATDNSTLLATTAFVQAQKINTALTGIPTAPTAVTSDSSTQIATTAFVQAQKVSPEFTGVPTVPTATTTDSSTQIASTAFVQAQKENIVLTGTPVAPTPAATDNSTQLATTAFVQTQKINTALTGIPTAPTADPATNNTQIATTAFVQAQKNSIVLTGVPVAPTPSTIDNSTQIATTAFVQAQKSSPSFTGTPTSPTPPIGSNNTQLATTAFVNTAISVATGTLGSMSQQNSNAVNITGGTITGIDGLLPRGVIMMWSGSSSSIPTGFLLCNGSNGTPDLRDRFVVGAGSTYAVGATGGSADSVVVSHTHVVTGSTDQGGLHKHATRWTWYDGGAGRGLVDPVNPGTGNFYIDTTEAGLHNHTISNGQATATGVSGTNKNLPPYYALCYIMKA